MTPLACPACTGTRTRGRYLCSACWYALPADARRALNQRARSVDRLRQLLDQIRAGVPLSAIRIE